MLVIRLFRIGKKNQPFFKIVVTDKKKPTTHGRFVEELGNYNPLTKEKVLRGDRIKYWLSVGAKPSPTVYNLLISEKIIEGKKIDVHKKAKGKKGKPVEGTTPAPVGKGKPAATASAETPPVKEEKKVEEKPTKAPVKRPVVEEKKEEAPKTETQKEETPAIKETEEKK